MTTEEKDKRRMLVINFQDFMKGYYERLYSSFRSYCRIKRLKPNLKNYTDYLKNKG